MQFGYFSHVWSKPGYTPATRYEQLWRELQRADDLAFDYALAVEHHFRPDESWMPAPTFFAVGGGARTKRIRLGAMGHIVPLHHPIRLAEEIACLDQMLNGRLEVGLVPGIVQEYFRPYQADYENRRARTLEFVAFMRKAYAATETFDFDGRFFQCKDVKLSVKPTNGMPRLWIETRDPPTLEFCAKEGINTGYFFLFDRQSAAPRYRKYLEQWRAAGWQHTPTIGYSTTVYVDETDEKAIARGLKEAGRAYRTFFGTTPDDASLQRLLNERAEQFVQRGEAGAAETVRHLNDPEWLLENDLVLVGSPETVTRKLRDWAQHGVFNAFLGEFNFGALSEDDLMRSIHLFGTEVMPKLRDFEPF